MLKAQMPSDRIAMGLSLACVLHCFLAPSLIVLSYGVSSFNIESELIHYLIIMLTVPISIFALTLGYKNHKGVSFREPLQQSLDGNTVELAVEQMEFSENSIRYSTTLNFLNSKISGLMSAIRGE